MAKRARKSSAKFHEYDALDLDRLYVERKSVGLHAAAVGQKLADLNARSAYLNQLIRDRKDGDEAGKIGISDHAVVRYLQRVKGVDIVAVRNEIRALSALRVVTDSIDQIASADGVNVAISNGSRVATIWTDGEHGRRDRSA